MSTPAPLPSTIAWIAASEDDTARLAQRLAAAMHADRALADVLLTLRGELGAGKTTFVRHLLRSLGVTGRIKSPTYALVEPYELPAAKDGACALPAWHADLYRFDDPREWEDAGLRELFATPGLKLVEWPEKAAALLPMPDLDLRFLHGDSDDERHIVPTARTPRGAALLTALA
ncbi:MAG: tRNA (adenosine(37)-N6)-threonylcarbamoyltransferase complex ATPase subunit type 1 TsaE [Tepidimonas sp.]|uniref:tRNA (adenosine(37)-N6)-threonylcarbamoyltransferase complex ATPase subunit type 1 TsaE n=1 Tax=Tepidimonas sp. TaxID=2002775 RepID=UPI004054E2A1